MDLGVDHMPPARRTRECPRAAVADEFRPFTDPLRPVCLSPPDRAKHLTWLRVR